MAFPNISLNQILIAIWGVIRYALCKHIFMKCGKHVNIERKAFFASGIDIEIGDYSGIGINAHVPNGTIIGNYVMMGPNCFILDVNHDTSDTTRPMCQQGMTEKKITRIGNDVWIGRYVHMTPGRTISDGSVIAMRAVLTKDFLPYLKQKRLGPVGCFGQIDNIKRQSLI